jgi:rhodanese-related sulfurtransferase
MSPRVSLQRTSLDEIAHDPDRVVVDLRPRRAFAESHWPGAINVELGQSFAAYFGWSVPWGARVVLVDDEWSRIEQAAASLRRIGIVEVEGALHHRDDDESSFRVVDFATLKQALSEGQQPQIVDARDRAEWNDGHIVGAASVPFYCSEAGAALLPRDTEVWVHCARGYRAAIAASLLQRHRARPVLVDDLFENAVGLGLTNSLVSVPV